jgi:hypothetical protein
MRFYTPKECEEWCQALQVPLDEQQQPVGATTGQHHLRCAFPASGSQLLWFSRCIEAALQPRQNCLVWVTGHGIFPSCENQHLYYRLRQSYGEMRLLAEAPGHLCLDYERPEVVTLLHLGMLFGWDLHLIPTAGYGGVFVSHDEWAEISFADQRLFDETRAALEKAELEVTTNEPASQATGIDAV